MFIYLANEFAREMNSYSLDKPTLTWWGSFQTKCFQKSASMRWTQLNDGVATARFKGLSKLDRIYSSVLEWTLCYVRTAPEVSVEEGKYASRFFRKFLRKFIRVVFYFSWLRPVNWHFCTVHSLKALFMKVLDGELIESLKGLDTELSAQDTIANLNSGTRIHRFAK